jgi:adenine-specific DNA-methyltransferase
VDIAGCAMPMQKIERIDEPRRAAAATGQWSLFEQQNPRVDDFRNRLFACVAQPFWGDNKLVMALLLQEFKGKVDLIYIDPRLMWAQIFLMSVTFFVNTMKTPMEAMKLWNLKLKLNQRHYTTQTTNFG